MPFQSKDIKLRSQLTFITVFLLVIASLASLGIWQLKRAEEKQAIETVLEERGISEPLWVGKVKLRLEDSEYRQGIAQGRFDGKHTMLLDNQIHQGRAGYHVLTPLRLTGSESAILVNRGWIPISLDRRQLPSIATPNTQVTVHGILRRPPQAPFFLGDEINWKSTGWPKLIQYVDIKELQLELDYSLQPLILQLAVDEPHGFVRQQFEFPASAQQHLAYAAQWFIMALIAVVAFVILYRRRFGSKK